MILTEHYWKDAIATKKSEIEFRRAMDVKMSVEIEQDIWLLRFLEDCPRQETSYERAAVERHKVFMNRRIESAAASRRHNIVVIEDEEEDLKGLLAMEKAFRVVAAPDKRLVLEAVYRGEAGKKEPLFWSSPEAAVSAYVAAAKRFSLGNPPPQVEEARALLEKEER